MYYFYIYIYFIVAIPLLSGILMYIFTGTSSKKVIQFVKTSLTWFCLIGLLIGTTLCIYI